MYLDFKTCMFGRREQQPHTVHSCNVTRLTRLCFSTHVHGSVRALCHVYQSRLPPAADTTGTSARTTDSPLDGHNTGMMIGLLVSVTGAAATLPASSTAPRTFVWDGTALLATRKLSQHPNPPATVSAGTAGP